MLNIDPIQNGIVIDHIQPGGSMRLVKLAGLEKSGCRLAIIQHVRSNKTSSGEKDMIKLEGDTSHLNLDVLGYLDPGSTIAVIRNGEIVKKGKPTLPQRLPTVIPCKTPRCITSIEPECDHIFYLTANGTYRCLYCEQPFKKNSL